MKSGLSRALRRPRNATPVRFSQAMSDTPWQDWDYNDTRETDVQAMERLGDVFGIIDLISTAVARVKWSLYRKQEHGDANRFSSTDEGSDEREEVLSHPALTLVNQPNPFMHGKFLRHAVQQHRELTGEGYLIIERGSLAGRRVSLPIGMWYARPDRIDPVPNAANYLIGYVYTGPDGVSEPLRLDEVIPMLRPNPNDPYHGLGPVQSILVDIDSARYTSEWNRNFFMNGAPPGGVFEFEKNLSDREWDEFVNRWRESHQGVMRAHRIAFVEGGKWTPEAAVVKDMDFGNLRSMTADVIRRAWRIHKHMLGDVDDVNRANAETAEETFVRWQVIDRLEDWKLAYNGPLLKMYGQVGAGVEFDYKNPLPQSRDADMQELTAKANALFKMVTAGFDPEDSCRVVGFPAMRYVGVAGMQVPASGPEPAEPGATGAPEGDPSIDPALWVQGLRPFTPRAMRHQTLNGARR